MPEGPEVETIRRGLEVSIVGQTVAGVTVLWERSFAAPLAMAYQAVAGSKILHVARRAKVLLIDLDSGYTMLFHLKMTGQMVLVKMDGERYAGGHPTPSMGGSLPDTSTRVVF